MTSLRLTLGAIALMLIGLLAPTPPASAQEPREADFSEFYEALEPHGRWLTHPDHGYVWSPHVAADDEDWRPYTRGHWVPTEEHGWYWVSDEPFGWAVYHYGRWRLDERDGWIWIPGSEWAPAWVAWRDSDEHVGWAPLPPEARWDGVTLSYRSDFADAPWYAPYWVFVSPGYIGQPGLYRHVVPHARNAYYLRRSRFATDYRAIDRRIFNRGIDPRVLESRTARPIPFVRITPGHSHREHGMQRGDRSVLQVYRPQFRPAPAIPVVPRITPPQESRQARTREGGDFGLRRWSGERRGDYGARGANAPASTPATPTPLPAPYATSPRRFEPTPRATPRLNEPIRGTPPVATAPALPEGLGRQPTPAPLPAPSAASARRFEPMPPATPPAATAQRQLPTSALPPRGEGRSGHGGPHMERKKRPPGAPPEATQQAQQPAR